MNTDQTESMIQEDGVGDLLTLGMATAVLMWTLGFSARISPGTLESWEVHLLLIGGMIAGGWAAGKYSSRGIRAGIYSGVITAVVNLLILGGVLAGGGQGKGTPPALLWIPAFIIAGALLGAVGAVIGARRVCRFENDPNWKNLYTMVAVCGTFVLVTIGGIVTSKEAGLAVVDWPNTFGYNMFLYPLSKMSGGIYYEHSHRLFGAMVGLILLVMVIYFHKIEQRRAVRMTSLFALLAVAIQGVLGGLRVTGRLTLSTTPSDMSPSTALALIHGVFGQVVLALVVSLAVTTTRRWMAGGPPRVHRSAGTDQAISTILAIGLVLQLAIGALLRHFGGGLMVHIALASVLLVLAVVTGSRAWGFHPDDTILRRTGLGLIFAAVLQGFLGAAAWMLIGRRVFGAPPGGGEIFFTTAHQVVGATVLVLAVSMALWNRRLLTADDAGEPDVSETDGLPT